MTDRPRIEDIEVPASASDGDVPTVDTATGYLIYSPGGGGGGADWSVVDAKGDLIVGTANDTVDNLTVGAAGKVLIPDSTQTTGLRWSETLGLGANPPSPVTLYVRRLDDDYAIIALATSSDGTDINFDKAIVVKHDVLYTATPGYSGSLQLYTSAGTQMSGAILGANRYVGQTNVPSYAPGDSEVADGWVRFELGPIWPQSEVARFNNRGDFIVGWDEVRKHTASQSGTTVTATVGSFVAGDVGTFLCWGDNATNGGGPSAFVDRITGFTSATVVTVETSRTQSSQKARVCTPRLWVDTSGNLQIAGNLTANDADFSGSVTIDGDLTVTGTVTSPSSSTAFMPLTTTIGGVPELVWDADNSLIPTEVPL